MCTYWLLNSFAIVCICVSTAPPAGISSAALTAQGVYAPTTQAFLSYCLLAVVHGAALLPCTQQLLARWQGGAKQPGLRRPCTSSSSSNVVIGVRGDASLCGEQQACVDSGSSKHSRWQRIRRLWPAFAALALIDVEANVLVSVTVNAQQQRFLTGNGCWYRSCSLWHSS